LLAQPLHKLHAGKIVLSGLGRGTEAGDGSNVLGAGAASPLLAATGDERWEACLPRMTSAPTPLGPPSLCAESVK
jgi:hypothetical protein